MSERKKPKAIIERGLKTCTVEIVARRHNVNPDTMKTIYAWFHMTGIFTIDGNKRFKNWSLTKIVRNFKFSWMEDFSMKTVVILTDGYTTFQIRPTEPIEYGCEFEVTAPQKITEKEMLELVSKGAYIFELDGNDNLSSLGIARFSKR